jgi:hypothetical protein
VGIYGNALGNHFQAFWTLKALSIIFLTNDTFFLQIGFLSVKYTFKPLKRTLKHALSVSALAFH